MLGSGLRDCFGFKIIQHFEVGSQSHSTQGSVNPLTVRNMYLRTHISKKHPLLPVRTFNLQRARKVKAFTLSILRKSCGPFCFYWRWGRGKTHTCYHCPEMPAKEVVASALMSGLKTVDPNMNLKGMHPHRQEHFERSFHASLWLLSPNTCLCVTAIEKGAL